MLDRFATLDDDLSLCRLADTSLPGIELARIQRLLDEVLADPRVDEERVGMWGLSLGGLATMFWMPLEPRIKAGVVAAWFNHRRNKMVIPDPTYNPSNVKPVRLRLQADPAMSIYTSFDCVYTSRIGIDWYGHEPGGACAAEGGSPTQYYPFAGDLETKSV